jgi:hypothetical protein
MRTVSGQIADCGLQMADLDLREEIRNPKSEIRNRFRGWRQLER